MGDASLQLAMIHARSMLRARRDFKLTSFGANFNRSCYCMILFTFCLETNSLFSLFALLGFIFTGQPKLESQI